MAKKRSVSLPRAWQYVSLAVVGAVVLGLTVAALQPRTAPLGARDRPVLTADDFATETTTLPTAVFLGDSYTQGTGATSESTRWASLVAAGEGWAAENLGRGGTGYVTTSDVNGCGLSYCPPLTEMAQTITGTPDVIVVAGGQNDFDEWASDPAAVTAAISSTFSTIRARFPDALIVAVGPSTPWDNLEDVVAMSAAVQGAAQTVGATFVSLIDPPVLTAEMIADDGAHANDLGHQAIADRVLSGLGG